MITKRCIKCHWLIHLYYISISLGTIEKFCFRYPFFSGIKSSVGTEGQARDRMYICKHGYCAFRTLLEILSKLLPSPTDILFTGGPHPHWIHNLLLQQRGQVYKHMSILHSNHAFLNTFLIIPCTPLFHHHSINSFPCTWLLSIRILKYAPSATCLFCLGRILTGLL